MNVFRENLGADATEHRAIGILPSNDPHEFLGCSLLPIIVDPDTMPKD
jgi:hypothetical protein